MLLIRFLSSTGNMHIFFSICLQIGGGGESVDMDARGHQP